MPAQLICPTCGKRLTVSDNAPRRLTCPRCLARIDRPAALPVPPPLPMQVIPIDDQAHRDTRVATFAIVAFSFLLVIGLLLGLRTELSGRLLVIALLIAVAIGCAQLLRVRQRRATPPVFDQSMSSERIHVDPMRPVLDYRRPLVGNRRGRPGASLGAFATGFFAAIGVGAACFFLLAATAGGGNKQPANGLYLLLVVCALIGTAICGGSAGARWPGFGAGVATGLGLAMFALLPCGACYLMTL